LFKSGVIIDIKKRIQNKAKVPRCKNAKPLIKFHLVQFKSGVIIDIKKRIQNKAKVPRCKNAKPLIKFHLVQYNFKRLNILRRAFRNAKEI